MPAISRYPPKSLFQYPAPLTVSTVGYLVVRSRQAVPALAHFKFEVFPAVRGLIDSADHIPLNGTAHPSATLGLDGGPGDGIAPDIQDNLTALVDTAVVGVPGVVFNMLDPWQRTGLNCQRQIKNDQGDLRHLGDKVFDRSGGD